MSEINDAIDDLYTAQYYLRLASKCLERLIENGAGGQDIKDMFVNVADMIDVCNKFYDIWRAKAAPSSMVRIVAINTAEPTKTILTIVEEETEDQYGLSFIDSALDQHGEREKIFNALETRQAIPVTLEKALGVDADKRSLKDLVI